MIATLLALAAATPAVLSPADIVAAAPPSEWVRIADEDLLVMDLDASRRIVIQLMPAPLSTAWVANIRTLATARWWDGTSINRVQDNYVVQWGDATEKKPLPALLPTDARGYVTDLMRAKSTRLRGRDAYAAATGFVAGWPVAFADARGRTGWPVHCYASVGVGRDLPPNAGTGAELYAVIGHAPRHLDRNIALVGRVIAGIEHLSSLPRGTGALGFYTDASARIPIAAIRLARDLPADARPHFDYLSTDGASFARLVAARQNRRDAFFVTPAGGADLCNIPVPVRAAR